MSHEDSNPEPIVLGAITIGGSEGLEPLTGNNIMDQYFEDWTYTWYYAPPHPAHNKTKRVPDKTTIKEINK